MSLDSTGYETYSYHNLEVELTNVKSDRTETMIDDGGSEWKYIVITCYPGAELTIINANMSDPAYSADSKAHPNWGILVDPYNSANRIEITDDMQPLELNSDMRGVYSLESHLYVLSKYFCAIRDFAKLQRITIL